jgi:5-methylcytosine-specific restriction endonuclease McrA
MAWERNGSSARKLRLPPDWPAIRQRILRRDNYRCQIPGDDGRKCLQPAREVDHIQPGDDHRPANLRAACTKCHAKKSSEEGVQARRRCISDPEPHPGLIR